MTRKFEIVSLNVSELKGERKTPVESIRLVADNGIEGAAHAGPGHRQVSRHDRVGGSTTPSRVLRNSARASNAIHLRQRACSSVEYAQYAFEDSSRTRWNHASRPNPSTGVSQHPAIRLPGLANLV